MVNEIKLQVATNRGYASNVFHNFSTRLVPYYEPTNVGNECLVGEIELKNKNVPKSFPGVPEGCYGIIFLTVSQPVVPTRQIIICLTVSHFLFFLGGHCNFYMFNGK